jgi:hypothetical protein
MPRSAPRHDSVRIRRGSIIHKIISSIMSAGPGRPL